MNPNQNSRTSLLMKTPSLLRRFSAVVAASVLAMISPLNAANFTWTGGNATSGTWGPTSGNWDTTPTFNNTADLIFNTMTRATDNEIGFGRTVRSITFGDNIVSTWTTNMTSASVLTFSAASGNASINITSGSSGNIAFNGGTGFTGSQSLTSQLEINHSGSGLLSFNRQTAGAGGITKTGVGTVLFTGFNANSFTGPLNVNGGRVILANTQNATADLVAAVNITLGGGTLEMQTSGGFGKTLSQNITVSSASTLAYNNTTNTSQSLVLNTGTMAVNANLTVQNISSNATIQSPIVINRSITGSGDLIVKTYNNVTSSTTDYGLGRVALSGNNTGWSGNFVISEGTANVFGNSTLGSGVQTNVGTGKIILGETSNSFGAGLQLAASAGGGAQFINNDIIVRSGGFRTIRGGSDHTYTLNGTITLEGDLNVHNGLFFTDKNMILNGNISGVGGLSITESGNPNFTRLTGNNTYTGATSIGTGAVLNILSASGNAIGDSSAVTFAGAGATLVFNSTNETVGSIASSGTDGAINLGANTITTGGNNASTSFGGVIGGTGGSLNKAGIGTMTLTSNQTYTGGTTVSAGTLLLASGVTLASTNIQVSTGASLDASASGLTIGSGKTLGGTGTIIGAVTVDGNLNPGNSPGDLTFNDALTLGGTSTLTLEITGITGGSFDRLLGDNTNTLSLGGTLAFNNTGYVATLGDTITVFSNWNAISGSFASFTGTDLGGGLSWDTSNLAVNGSLSVIPEPSTWALLALGMTTMVVFRRRRSS